MFTVPIFHDNLRVFVRSHTFPQIDAYYADLEQQDWTSSVLNCPYSEAILSGTLFDYSTVPSPQATDFLQAWIAAWPRLLPRPLGPR
ncbi:DUF4034 domain-containing protein [Achromobacter xylosoxidans]|uniref:DUF4034 domain-containing protein n=1 Tax=Alcaligenes xylosoxydans xylosoxydans TaxID=85698 RepID=UPI0022B88E34|nr:DUF4034 domain-containing protein [Achromobacter xylosoxidans]MCZ8437129.1 DUF4034 domain-containing protein [Achromobacter xylosoxidans]